MSTAAEHAAPAQPPEPEELRRHGLARLWPRTLYGQIVLILAAGMLAAQLFTGSVWYDMRRGQEMEVPLRLAAARTADAVRALQGASEAQAAERLALLRSPHFDTSLHDQPAAQPAASPVDRNAEALLRKVLAQKLGAPVDARLLEAYLDDNDGQPAGWAAFFGARAIEGHFWLEVPLGAGRWLQVRSQDEQGWSPQSPWAVATDYVLRIYLLRVLVIVLLALLALRLAIGPLKQLAQAAQALGEDIHRPPLPVQGPVEVRRAARAFNHMQQRLIASLEQRGRIMAAVSHDLRTPITRLRLRTELLEDEALQQRFRHDLDDMEALVTATLDTVQQHPTREPMQRVDIQTLLFSLQEDFLALEAHIDVQGQAAPIQGYARSLRRGLQNLIENAVRYGCEVLVQVEDGPDVLHLSVLDRGPGIPAHALNQVFEPFYRLEPSRSSATGGYGLGLSIALTVAQAHGGTLQLHNREGGGLEARLSLPRRPADGTR